MRAMILAASLSFAITSAGHAEEAGLYPDWGPQWTRVGSGQYDPNAASGVGQKPPLVPEYQAIFEAAVASRKEGSLAYNATSGCLPAGMPRAMIIYESMEFIITPAVTYIKLLYMNELRRIFTDGRDWPTTLVPTFIGTSIGHWEKGKDGRYEALVVETRGFKGPRTFDAEGIALHSDNQTIVKERLFIDAANPDRLHDEVTVFDHALTRPWTVLRTYKREKEPSYADFYCSQNNAEVQLGRETYYIGQDKLLMPTRKQQPPPDLSAFRRSAP